jgi:ribosomal-protein-alanine N-acetyltransferase
MNEISGKLNAVTILRTTSFISKNISIKKINDKYAVQLIEILNTDDALLNKLGSKKRIISKDEFAEHNNEWAKSTNSEIFAVVLNDNAIGMISLSYQSIEEKKAQIGYWIGSKYWGKGYTSQAFLQILCCAERKGIRYLNAKILKHNLASKKIWQKYNAKMELIEDRIYASLDLLNYNIL